MMNNSDVNSECPICSKVFPADAIEIHVNRCIFLNTTTDNSDGTTKEPKRTFSVFQSNSPTSSGKKAKLDVIGNGIKKKTTASVRPSSSVEKMPTIEIKDDVDDPKRSVSEETTFRQDDSIFDFLMEI